MWVVVHGRSNAYLEEIRMLKLDLCNEYFRNWIMNEGRKEEEC